MILSMSCSTIFSRHVLLVSVLYLKTYLPDRPQMHILLLRRRTTFANCFRCASLQTMTPFHPVLENIHPVQMCRSSEPLGSLASALKRAAVHVHVDEDGGMFSPSRISIHTDDTMCMLVGMLLLKDAHRRSAPSTAPILNWTLPRQAQCASSYLRRRDMAPHPLVVATC